MLAFRLLLVPTDFTDTSDRALDWALDFASQVGAAVTVMHAYELPLVGFPDGTLIPSADVASRMADASRAALDRVVAARRERGVKVEAILREGVPWEEINRVADEIDADIVVIGTHGRRGLARALLGSVAENVIRTTHRPVLTIHGPRD